LFLWAPGDLRDRTLRLKEAKIRRKFLEGTGALATQQETVVKRGFGPQDGCSVSLLSLLLYNSPRIMQTL
jgi:hypothetical protein